MLPGSPTGDRGIAIVLGVCLLAGAAVLLAATGAIATADAPGRTLYADVSDDHAGQLDDSVPVTVRYFDDGNGTFGIEYAGGTESGAATPAVELDGDGEWETHTFELDDAAFPTASGDIVANGGHDFEVTLAGSLIGRSDGDVCFESVTLGTAPTTGIAPSGAADGTGSDGGQNGTGGEAAGGTAASGGTDTGGNGSSDDSGLPGFGVGAALVALVSAALLARRRGR